LVGVAARAARAGYRRFSPEPQLQVLEEGEGELAQECVVVQPAPRAPLEVVEAEFVLHLLVHLLANPASLIAAARTSSGVSAGWFVR
jgi:hypothetical protein